MKTQKTQFLAQAAAALVLLLAGGTVSAATAATEISSSHETPVAGTITSIDAAAGTITVTPSGGTASVVRLTTATVLTGHASISGSSIAVGDTLDLVGIPLALQVSSITDDHTGTSAGTATAAGTAAKPITPTAATAAASPELATGTVHLRGVVTSLNPPTVKVNNSFSLELSSSSSLTVSESVTITASQIAVGDTAAAQVFSSGGTLTATRLDVTIPSS